MRRSPSLSVIGSLGAVLRAKRLGMLDEANTSVDAAKPAIDRHFKTGHFSPATETCGVLLRGLLRAQVGVDLGSPAPRSTLEHVGVM